MNTHLLTMALLVATIPAQASVIITYAEDPGSTLSSLADTSVYNFDKAPLGLSTNVVWSGVGTFDRLFIKGADAYGGAADASSPKGTRYSLQGAGTSVLSSTLRLDMESSYFGMWWSAGDARNVLEFYNGDTLISRFTTASLMEPLPAAYDGNPINRAINSREPYAFINFFGDDTTAWDRIVLTNDGSSGFESDNYTSRVAAWDPLLDGALPGIAVATVSGTTTTLVTEKSLEGSRWSLDASSVAAIPGAPAPPWILLAAFVTVLMVRRSTRGTRDA